MLVWSLWLTCLLFDVLHFAQNIIGQKISFAQNRRTMFGARLARIIDTHCRNMSESDVSGRGMSDWCANDVGVKFLTHCCVLWCSWFRAKHNWTKDIFCSKSTDHVWGTTCPDYRYPLREHVREWCKWPWDVRLMCQWCLWLTVVFFDVLHFAQNIIGQKISFARNRWTIFVDQIIQIFVLVICDIFYINLYSCLVLLFL